MREKYSQAREMLEEFLRRCMMEQDPDGAAALTARDVYVSGLGPDELAFCRGREELRSLMAHEMSVCAPALSVEVGEFWETLCAPGVLRCMARARVRLGRAGERGCLGGIYTVQLTALLEQEAGETRIGMLQMSRWQGEERRIPLRFVPRRSHEFSQASRQELADIICQIMPGGVLGGYLEEGLPLYVINDNLLRWLGYTYEELLERTGGKMTRLIHPDDLAWLTALASQELERGGQYEAEYRMLRKDGGDLWVHDVGRRITTQDGREAIISVIVDVSENVRVKNHLLEEAARDELTGVYNRRGGEALISKALSDDQPYLFLIMDLDNFKTINDCYGHQEGDAVLQYVAALLRQSFRSTDVIFRLGGDEFVVFVHPCRSVEGVEHKLESLSRSYREEMAARYPLCASGLSIGGVFGRMAVSFNGLYHMADRILYEIKHSNKGGFIVRELKQQPACACVWGDERCPEE